MQSFGIIYRSIIGKRRSYLNSLQFRFLFIFLLASYAHSTTLLSVSQKNFHHTSSICKTSTNYTGHFITADIPFQSNESSHGIEADIEPSEDDLNHSTPTISSTSPQKFILDEIVFTSFIKSRYLRLASSIHNKDEVPFFVLYHSWKNYII